ncbi:hypothetical protein ABZ442_20200 [Streptomyces triculaminicus]|uniref:hypothetical protein n=1 Tax=Streptomyces triculaminicus TaxID=2816232 RepID=UPI0033D84DA6
MSPTAMIQLDDQLAEFDLDIRLGTGDLTSLDPRMSVIPYTNVCTTPMYCGPDSTAAVCQVSMWGGC